VKKFTVIMVLGLALLLTGLTLSASAVVTINAPWAPDTANTNEENLYTVFNDARFAGTAYSNATFNTFANSAGVLLETLPTTDGTFNFHYTITGYYASWSAFNQTPGWYLAGNAVSATPFGFDVNTAGVNGIYMVPSEPIAFAPGSDFGFYDLTSGGGTKYTETALNAGGLQNGLIFDLGAGHYIVAFEDGAGIGSLGDGDYQDLVLNVRMTQTLVPLPPSALLLGSGLLGLVGVGWRRRKTNV
jgi:hypothetical protein